MQNDTTIEMEKLFFRISHFSMMQRKITRVKSTAFDGYGILRTHTNNIPVTAGVVEYLRYTLRCTSDTEGLVGKGQT